ncbi:hypothetical protein Vadar_006974 [Vaccinium darrowii]|uniref:Uncharacterized protein n=1 Tax=Vaccinium darrowii TaxID=229202 RepID=A0ACB7Y5J3_9ERIC|nr:hypothetical protein Vadar_006974 [Vaccinium darrowii]
MSHRPRPQSQLSEEEQSEISLIDDDIKASEEECRTSLFGRVVSQKPANLGGLKSTMELIWGSPKNFKIWGLPIHFISKAVGLKVGAKLGHVDDVSVPETGSKEGRYVRVRILLDITQPLRRGFMVKLADSPPFWAEFRYERLPIFCHYCGLVGHDLLNCITRFFDVDMSRPKSSAARDRPVTKSPRPQIPYPAQSKLITIY